MIFEYAIEPEMAATWGTRHNYRFFIHSFGLSHGRLVSRYPKKWAKRVWESFVGENEMEKKRLTELLVQLQETMIKRKDCLWDDDGTWIDNALHEHSRHPFRAVLARNNPVNLPLILAEDKLAVLPCTGWDNPHGITRKRKAHDMAAAIEMMLARCRWVKFIDPFFCKCKRGHKLSLPVFLDILKTERPVGPPEKIEIHTRGNGATIEYMKDFYEKIIPANLQVALYQWEERPGGQHLHNRYILTDLGGVSFHHGLDTGADGETDDITRLDREQYIVRCKQYDPTTQAFDEAACPLELTGRVEE